MRKKKGRDQTLTNEKMAIAMDLLKVLTESEDGQKEQAPVKPALPRMRTIPAAMREIKEADPNTGFTINALRCAIKQGKIPSVEVRSKRLVDMDKVYEYMNCALSPEMQPDEQPKTGTIRRVM